MSTNVLTEIPWIPTRYGLQTPLAMLQPRAEADGNSLWRASDIQVQTGMEYMAVIRFLTSIMAVAQRYWQGDRKEIDSTAIARACGELEPYVQLKDEQYPFMQRPLGKAEREKLKLDPPTKLDLSTPAASAREFWNFLLEDEEKLPEAEAILALVVFHYYGPAGNNKYGNDKCQMGAPGLRFLGANNTATEVLWRGGGAQLGDQLHRTLLLNLPKAWCNPGALPAWADRERKASDAGHPLWRATWSSNTVICQWDEENNLLGVKRCGVPANWYAPVMGTTKEEQKNWWDERNEHDPFYLYVKNRQGELKAVRLDFGRDATELAVNWNQNKLSDSLLGGAKEKLLAPNADIDTLMFARHLIAGTSSSPLIRQSEMLICDTDLWVPDPDYVELASSFAEQIFQIRNSLWYRMGPERTEEGQKKTDEFSELRPDALNLFWQGVARPFADFMHHPDEGEVMKKARLTVRDTALAAFSEATRPIEDIKLPAVERRARLLRGDLKRKLEQFEEE